MEKFTKGQSVYDRSGRKLHFRRDLGDGTAIVSRWLTTEGWEGEIEEYVSDEPMIVTAGQLFLSPPTDLLAKEVAELQASASAARDELSSLRQAAVEAQRAHNQMLATIKASEPLQNIEAFIAGKITHFVMINQSYDGRALYGDVSVVTFKQGITFFKDNGRADGMKLLSLCGGSKGDLSWRINHYSDGSGSYKLAVPCLSEEEALAKAAETLDLFWAGFKPNGNDYRIASAIKSADVLGFPVPANIRAHIDAKVLAGLSSNVTKAREALRAAEAALAAQSGAPA